jgi:hypothetical protein
MSDLFKLLEKIKKAPGMYIGRPAVTDLFLFLAGYRFACREMTRELNSSETRFALEFQPWLQQKLGVKTTASWAKLILMVHPDESVGFELFYELLAEFRSQEESNDLPPARESDRERLAETIEYNV